MKCFCARCQCYRVYLEPLLDSDILSSVQLQPESVCVCKMHFSWGQFEARDNGGCDFVSVVDGKATPAAPLCRQWRKRPSDSWARANRTWFSLKCLVRRLWQLSFSSHRRQGFLLMYTTGKRDATGKVSCAFANVPPRPRQERSVFSLRYLANRLKSCLWQQKAQ